MSKVYTFGPTFRAEKSSTNRHLSEFWMVEPEIAHVTLEQLIEYSTNMVKSVIKDLLQNSTDDMNFFSKWVKPGDEINLEDIVNTPFEIITYDDAVKLLQNNKKTITWGMDLSREDETFLCDEFVKKATLRN
jgi:asparaginyl-tRNA synthetase